MNHRFASTNIDFPKGLLSSRGSLCKDISHAHKPIKVLQRPPPVPESGLEVTSLPPWKSLEMGVRAVARSERLDRETAGKVLINHHSASASIEAITGVGCLRVSLVTASIASLRLRQVDARCMQACVVREISHGVSSASETGVPRVSAGLRGKCGYSGGEAQ